MAGRMGHTYRTVEEMAQATSPLRPVGGVTPQGIPLIGGMDGVITSVAAAAREIHDAAKELKIINDRQAKMFGTSSNRPGDPVHDVAKMVKDAIEEQTKTLTQLLPQVANGAVPAGFSPTGQPVVIPGQTVYGPMPYNPFPNGQYAGEAPAGMPTPDAATPGAPGVAPLPASSTGRAPAPTSFAPQPAPSTHGAPEVPSRREVYTHNRDFFKGDDDHFSLGRLRQTLGTRIQSRIGNREWGPQLAQDPTTQKWFHLDASGNQTAQEASSSEVAGFMRRNRVMGAVRGGAQTLAEGGTVREAGMALLPEGFAGAAGAVGAGVFAAEKVADFMEGQRAQNAQWQSMLGGTQSDAFEERARSKMFQFGQMGVLSGSDAAALYQGVAATGMNRDQRDNAQNFAVQNYKDLGMSIQDSLDIVSTASKTGQDSLDGLAQALKDVTDSAKEAGVNTEQARQQFTETWKAFSETLGGTSGAATVEAAGATKAVTSLGRRFQGVHLDMTNPDIMRMVGAQTGMSMDEIIAEANSPGGQTKYAQQYTQFLSRQTQTALGSRALQTIRQAIPQGKSFKDLSQGQQTALDNRILKENPGLDLQSLVSILGQYGAQGATTGNALDLAIQSITGDLNPGRKAQEEIKSRRTHHIDVGQGGILHSLLGGAMDSDAYKKLQHDVDSHSQTGWFGSRLPWSDSVQASNAFLADVRKTGRAGGISQNLIERADNGLQLASKLRVKTGSGSKVVSLEDAMKYYRDQIDAGTAKVVSGDGQGETIAAATDMVGDKSLSVTSNRRAADAARHGQITIIPAPALSRFFRFQTSGGAFSDPAAGWSPPSAHVTANARPSGSVDWMP